MTISQQQWTPSTGQLSRPDEPQHRSDTLLSEAYTASAMPKVVGTFGLTGTFVLIIFFITNVPSAIGAGAGTFTFWIIGALTFFIPCVIATAQLGHMFPHEGSLYNWTHRAFGGYWSFFVSFCAWFPCVLLMIVAADVVVNYLQGLNPNWLMQPWQQGLVLIAVIAFSGVLAVQPTATILNLVKAVLLIAFIAVFMVGMAGVVWLAGGHHNATSFKTAADWGFVWNPASYSTLAMFAFITQAFLGIEVPLNMGGELTGSRVVTRHLLWGCLLVLVGYFIVTFGVLVVVGANTSTIGIPFALVATVKTALGSAAGNVVAVLVLCNFVVTPAIYSYAYARLLLVGGIDQRLPVRIARLNKHRVPAAAIIFQTVIAIIFAAILFIAVPFFTTAANAGTLNTIVYNVVISASTLVWAISTAFLFINLVKFYFQDRYAFRKMLIFPMPVLWISIILGTVSCVLSIIGALVYSLIPNLIGNSSWWYIVGGITLVCITIAIIGSIFANSEASWQTIKNE